MSLTLGTVITAARDRSPWFHISRCPNAVIARMLSDAQNELIGAAVRRDPQYLAQQANVILSLSSSDQPGTVGAGTSGGTPGVTDDNGVFSTVQAPAGSLVEAKMTSADGAAIYVSDRVVSSATSTTLSSTGANRSTNQDAGRVIVIVAGTGYGQRRTVISNTSTQWTISTGSDGQEWETVPDTTSMFDVIVPAYESDDAATVFTAVPATTQSTGYLVKTSAQGVPYIDFTQPLVATTNVGVSLPSMQFPLDASVRYTDLTEGPCRIVSKAERFNECRAIYFDGQQLFLTGDASAWQSVESITVSYTPIAPPFAALTDYFLVPDHARPALIALAAYAMALRVVGMEGVTIDVGVFEKEAMRAQTAYLASVSAAKRGRGLRTREVW